MNKLCLALMAAGMLLSGCGLLGGNDRNSIQELAPLLQQGSAELGSQEQTRFTMQAIGCGQYLSAHRTSENVHMLQQGAAMSKGEGREMPRDRADLEAYQDCVENMKTTREAVQPPTVSIVVPAS